MAAQMLKEKLDAARSRLAEAQAIAEQLRHNPALHRLAMQAVFVLEDCVFSFDEAYRLAAVRVPQGQH